MNIGSACAGDAPPAQQLSCTLRLVYPFTVSFSRCKWTPCGNRPAAFICISWMEEFLCLWKVERFVRIAESPWQNTQVAFAASAGGSVVPNHVKSAEKQGVICTTAFAAHAAAKQSRKKQNTIWRKPLMIHRKHFCCWKNWIMAWASRIVGVSINDLLVTVSPWRVIASRCCSKLRKHWKICEKDRNKKIIAFQRNSRYN